MHVICRLEVDIKHDTHTRKPINYNDGQLAIQQKQFNNSSKNASVYIKSLATNDVVTQVSINSADTRELQ